MRPSLYRN